MIEKKGYKNKFSLVFIFSVIAIIFSFVIGLCLRPLVVRASDLPEDATLTDAKEKLEELKDFRASLEVASDSDAKVDKSPYLTNDTSPLPMQTNDYLLSIRNVLVCIWGTIIFIWAYDRLKAIIFRLSGYRKEK